MGALDNVKIGFDTPNWFKLKPTAIANAAGTAMCGDKRNDKYCDNSIYHMPASNLYRQSNWYNGSMLLGAHAISMAAGCWNGFAPSFGITGTLGAGCSTTKLVTSTALTAGTAITALWVNQLIRTDIYENYECRVTSVATGLTEEVSIVANGSWLTPVLYLGTPLTFTPSAWDTYEISSWFVYMVGMTTTAATQSKYFWPAQWVFWNAGAIGVTTSTASAGIVLDEKYVPFDRKSGEGFLVGASTYNNGVNKCLLATARTATTITGQALAWDAWVIANEYRNFQIRIVEDTATPTANGQRAIIASHTAGPSAVYTIGAAWAVTPSATAKFVIENPNVILLQNTAQAGMLTYNYNQRTITNGTGTIAANTWSSTYFNATHTAAIAAWAMAIPSWSHQPLTSADGARLTRHSYNYFFRGNSTTLDMFDIAWAINGLWTNGLTYNNPQSFTAGSCCDIDTVTFDGSYAYIIQGATAVMFQFNVAAPSLVPWVQLPLQSWAAVQSQRIYVWAYTPADPVAPATEVQIKDKIGMIYVQGHLTADLFRSDIIA